MRLVSIWPGVSAHASGGLWLEESHTLILADLHLGYGWAQRRKGQLGPLVDQQARTKIFRVVDELTPRKLLLLGDIVHAARPALEESAWIGSLLQDLAAQAEMVCVRGNHDRHFARDFEGLGITLVEAWSTEGMKAVHGDRLPPTIPTGERLVIGHLHPAVGLKDAAGVRQRVPAFLIAGPVIVLPAFSPFAAGLDVWRNIPHGVEALSNGAEPQVIAATGTRAVALGPLARQASPFKGSRPEDYRA